jgi:hypothetical protein
MNSVRSRILSVYRKQRPDWLPVGVYARYLPRGAVEREVRGQGLGVIEYFPATTMPGPPWHFYPGYLSEIPGAEIRVEHRWIEGRPVERRTFATPVGAVFHEIEYDPAGAGSEHVRKHFIARLEDYRVMTWLVERSVLRSNAAVIRARLGDLGEDGVVFARLDRSPYQKCLIEWAGAERFLLDLHGDPEPVLELMDALARKQAEALAIALESPAELLWQPDNVTSPMTPPAAFRKYLLPLYQERSRLARQAGKPYLVHIDGRLKILLPLLAQSGIDAIESFSLPEIGGDMELADAQAALPDSVVVPNVPANWAMLPQEAVAEQVRRLAAGSRPGVPLMLQISEDVPMMHWQSFARGVMAGVS